MLRFLSAAARNILLLAKPFGAATRAAFPGQAIRLAIAALALCATGFSQVRISQIYGAGGNSGALFNADYVELFNAGSSPASISGMSLQYASSTGTSWTSQISINSGTIPAGGYFLVRVSSVGANGAAMTPDLSSTSISMAAGAGKIALVSNQTTITAGTSCPSSAAIVDFVPYGTANCTNPTATISTVLAAFRAGGGCTDTDNSTSDFSALTPAPRNSASPLNVCGGGPTNLSATGTATPGSLTAGNNTTLAASVTLGTNPASTGLIVTCSLMQIGGSSTFNLPSPGFSAPYAVPGGTAAQAYSLPCMVTDSQSRSAAFSIALTVTGVVSTPPSGTGAANPNSIQAGASTLLTVTVTGGTNPASTGLAVSADLTTIGGSPTQQFFDNGTNGDAIAGDNIFSFLATVASNTTPGSKSLTATITETQGRSGNAPTIALTIQSPPSANTVKISQVYGGGGNSGSTYTNDFIELYNQSTSPVDISSWSIQQASATISTTWNITNLCPANGSCILQPGHYYLVQESQGTSGTTPLPAADITGTLAMGAASGKVALVKNTTPISGACPSSTDIADIVGYGGSAPTCFETTAVAALTNTTAAVRKGNGCVDTDNNTNDFLIIGPSPRNSSAPANVCGGNAGLPSGVGSATPSSVDPAGNLLLTVTVTPASAPPSTGLSVVGNLASIGGNASQTFYDDGTHGDDIAGNNVFSFRTTAPIPTGAKNIPTTISDAQSRTAPAPITITVQSPTCGVERWAVKTGTDSLAGTVNLNNPVRTTVNALRSIPAPVLNPNAPWDPRMAPTETTVFVVNGIMTFYKLEDDVDYHIVLQDTVGNTLITEIPSPACDGSNSPFDAAVAAVRAKFDARFTATPFFQNANVPVQMKGVGFFDFLHGQTGVAPNGIELHPLLDISFTAPSTTAVTSNVNPSTYGQQVTITATVAIASGTPTGVVSFFDGASLLGTGTLAANGKATFTTSALIAGAHTIAATYEGDSQAAQSASPAFAQNVNQAVPVITWQSPAAILYGGALGSSQLNATATIPGAFVYTPPAGTVLQVGNAQNLSVVFTPASSNYVAAAKNVTVDVLPASAVGPPSNLIVTRTLARVAGQVVATLTIANNGGSSAQNVVLTTAQIGATSGTPLPQSLGTIPARAAVMATVTFPGSVGISGAASTLSLAGTYTGGTFSSGARVTLP